VKLTSLLRLTGRPHYTLWAREVGSPPFKERTGQFIPIYYLDLQVTDAPVETRAALRVDVRIRLGKHLGPDGTIDRRALGAIVFAEPAALARLNAAVHPLIAAEVERRIELAQALDPVEAQGGKNGGEPGPQAGGDAEDLLQLPGAQMGHVGLAMGHRQQVAHGEELGCKGGGALPALPRHDKALPIGDGKVNRREGAGRQDRSGDDDASARLLVDHEIGADP
jgi:hypothetical protein